jgi:hypothetical protein
LGRGLSLPNPMVNLLISIEYEIELERASGKADHTSATLPPQLTKGQRLKVPVGDEFVDAEVIEVTELTSDEPPKWKLTAKEVTPQT